MIGRLNAVIKSWRFIGYGGAALLVLGAYTYGVDWVVSAWPPYRTASLNVIVQDGVPHKVVETRQIVANFNGSWQVRVYNLDGGAIVCYLPEIGPREQSYRTTDSLSFGPTWHGYTGDDGDCLKTMLAHPGVYQLETHRTMRFLWRNVDLPPVVSAPFVVGGE